VVVSKQFVQRHLNKRSFMSNLLELDSRKACGGCNCLAGVGRCGVLVSHLVIACCPWSVIVVGAGHVLLLVLLVVVVLGGGSLWYGLWVDSTELSSEE